MARSFMFLLHRGQQGIRDYRLALNALTCGKFSEVHPGWKTMLLHDGIAQHVATVSSTQLKPGNGYKWCTFQPLCLDIIES